MKNSYVDAQNRMLSVLGYLAAGTRQRWMWMWSEDIVYWRGRMRPAWVLAQWQYPKVDAATWVASFPAIPYPAAGMYHAKMETLLKPGETPDAELTANLIMQLDQQMSLSAEQHQRDRMEETAKRKADEDLEWIEFVQDTNPAFSNFDWGSRSSNVSFGGI